MKIARALVLVAIALALALAVAGVAGAQGRVWPESIPADHACPALEASLSAVVDGEAGRVYLRLVLENRSEVPVALPVALEKFPCHDSATFVLQHLASGKNVYYPGDMAVTYWKGHPPVVAPGESQEFSYALTSAWFEQHGTWSMVWRRADTELGEDGRLRYSGWRDATERVVFEVPKGFGAAQEPPPPVTEG